MQPQSTHTAQPEPAGSTRGRMAAFVLIPLGILVMAGLACCGVLGYTALVDNPFLSNACFDTRAKLEQFARFKYPASAANIHEDCAIWQSADIRIWFEMDPAELDAFLATTMVKPPLTADGITVGFGPSTTNHTLVHGHSDNAEDTPSQSVWVDETDPKRYRVYLEYIQP